MKFGDICGLYESGQAAWVQVRPTAICCMSSPLSFLHFPVSLCCPYQK